MPQNALLHFPLVDVVCLRQTVREHTRRVIRLIHEYNDYLSECKVFSASDKVRPTPFPLFLSELPNQSDFSLSVDDIFGVASGSLLIENNRTVSRGNIQNLSNSVRNRVRSSESNNLHKEVTCGSECRGDSEDNKANLKSLSCPEKSQPSEEKAKSMPVPGLKTYVTPPKAVSKMKPGDFTCESGNNVPKVKSSPSSLTVKIEPDDTKLDQYNSFEGEDEVVVIEVKKEKEIEVITIEEEEEEEEEKGKESTPPLQNSAIQVPVISKPVKTVNATTPRENWEVPPYLTPEISQPPCLSPEIMEPIFTPELSQPPLIFPEIDPPMWTFSVPSPMIYSEDAQPPILTPEVKNIGLAPDTDTSPLLSQPPLMSDALPPTSDTPDPLSLDLPSSSLASRETDPTQVSEFGMASHQDSTPFKASSEQSIHSENSTNNITSLQQPELPFSYSEAANIDDPFMITPKKTNDITKIKGWKTKQFLMEKREPVQCNISNKKAKTRKVSENSVEKMEVEIDNDKKSTENAFVSDKLDKFLEGEADLNIDYEIPYLYAELGITLTKDAVMSRPTVSEEEVKKFEKKYYMDIDMQNNDKGMKDSAKEVKDHEKEVRDLDNVVKNNDTRVKNHNKQVKKNDTRVKNRHKQVKKNDKRVKNNDNGVKNIENGVKNSENGVKNNENGVKNNDNGVKNNENGVKDKDKEEFSKNEEIDKPLIPEEKEKRGIKRKIRQGYWPKRTKRLVVRRQKFGMYDEDDLSSSDSDSYELKMRSRGIPSCSFEAKDFNGKAFKGHGSNKLLGLALYPGPNAPLPKAVQRCLDDFRSYRNQIDRNWANFALSALVVPKRCKYGRMILPIQYAGETKSRMKESTSRQSTIEVNDSPRETHTEVNKVVTKLVDVVSKESSRQSSEVLPARNKSVVKSQRPPRFEEPEKSRKKRRRTNEKTDKKGTNVKECKILVKKVRQPSRVWCMEHNRYNCRPCGFSRGTKGGKKKESTKKNTTPESFRMSTPLLSDQDISSFLTQKLRHTRWKDLVLSNIDTLKTVVPNALEFVKLNLVRENFMKKYIYIWYLKPHPNLRNKSRAFLTFSEKSPVPYAIRLRPDTVKFEEIVPKVLKDIITIKKENVETEYVILHCNGKVWQIHGSLRYATDKSSPDNFEKDSLKLEEVFTPTYPPELEIISEAATRVVKDPAVKWWVVDLNQKFTTIVSKLDSKIRTMTKKSILYGIRTRFYGFLALNKSSTRVIWVHLFPKILPYVLIGPYKLSEPHGLVLKQGLKVIPFSYHTHLCKSPNVPLKRFINSVITQVKEQERELKGLWLCDRQQVDKTCYLEVISKSSKENVFSMADYDVDVEHDYSLMSRINRDKRKVSPNPPSVKVYLYFDLFELGYVSGDLFDDNVVTHNPIDHKLVTIPLNSFAKWFLSLIKEKISFLPNTRNLKWFITKQLEDLKDRKPFCASFLKGHYMICEVGPFSVLKLVNMKNKDCEKEVIRTEQTHIKRLEYILYGTMNGRKAKYAKGSVLNQAQMEVKELDSLSDEEYSVYKRLITIELGARYIHMLESLKCDEAEKITLFEWIKDLFDENQKTVIDEYCKDVLQLYQFGRLYLILKEARDTMEADSKAGITRRPAKRMRRNRTSDLDELPCSGKKVMITNGEWRKKYPVTTKAADEMNSETMISIVDPLDETSEETAIETSVETETSEIIILDPSAYIVTNDNTDDDNRCSPSVEFIKVEAVEETDTGSSPLSADLSVVDFTDTIILKDEIQNVGTTFSLSQSDYVKTFDGEECSVITVQGLVCDSSTLQDSGVSGEKELSRDSDDVITIVESDSSEMETVPQDLLSTPNEGPSDISDSMCVETVIVPAEINITNYEERVVGDDSNEVTVFVPA